MSVLARKENCGTLGSAAASGGERRTSAAVRKGRRVIASLLEAQEFHLADCRYRNLSQKTLIAYRSAWDELIRWCRDQGEPLTLRSLNAQNVKDCAEAIRGRERHGKRGNQSAALAFVVNIKVASRFLVEEDVLEGDFLARVKRPKVARGLRRYFTLPELAAIRGELAANRTATRDIAMLELSRYSGLRIGELCGLGVADVDLDGCRVRVMGKGARERVVPFGTDERGGGRCARALREYKRRREPARPTDRFWLSHDGYPFTDKGWRGVFCQACQRAGLPGRVPHELRHTYATYWLVTHWGLSGAVEALRYNLGHLSDDEYRTYAGEAQRIVSERLGGRDDIYASPLEPEQRRTRSVI